MSKKRIPISVIFLLAIMTSSFTWSYYCKRQGIKGIVYRISGNQMPSPDVPPPAPQPMETTVYIYERTNIKQVARQGSSPFYTEVRSRLIKEIRSNSKGSFKVRLDPGEYSVFTRKGELFYANNFDQYNNIAPVTVEKGTFTSLDIRVDYDAAY